MTRLAKPKGAAATAAPTTFPAIPPADVLGLRRRSAEDCARDAAETGDHGEFRLHYLPRQRGHATRTNRRDA